MALVASLLDIQKPVRRTATYSPLPNTPSNSLPLKEGWGEFGGWGRSVYYQVFASRHGFLPDLSIVDLLFNEGPEGVLWL